MLKSYLFRRRLPIGPIRCGERPVIIGQSGRLKATVLLIVSSSALAAFILPYLISDTHLG